MKEITLGGMLEQTARDYPDNLCIKYTDRDYSRTYREFNEECDAVARGFMAMGIKKGDHVAIWATNIPEWFLTFFATVKVGAVLVTINTSYKIFELEYLLRQSDIKCLVLGEGYKSSDFMQILNELCPELKDTEPGTFNSPGFPYLKDIVFCGERKYPGCYNFSDLYSMALQTTTAEYQERIGDLHHHDVANIQYTSGTTGFPKGVMLTHYNLVNNGLFTGDCLNFTPEDKLCICVPMFHCFGMTLSLIASVTHASAMIPIDVFAPLKVLDALQNEECTACHGVPTMFISMLEHPEFKKYTFPRMRTGIMAGSPCPIKVMRQVVDQMNMSEITIVFGQTESAPNCTQTTTYDTLERRVSTVGRASIGVECKIVDPETNLELPVNTPGEFCARGYNIMKGYYKMPEATAQAIDKDGWLHTGDIATVDADGYYRITGRLKDMIIRGGENIYPKEVEEFLYTHPAVSDVQVIGIPSRQYGEEVMACIILKKGESITGEELREFMTDRIARHKIPKYFGFINEFPMTASGKIQKYKLRENAIKDLGLEDADAIETA